MDDGEYVVQQCSSFNGIYYTDQGRITIWRRTPDAEVDDVEADDYGKLLRFEAGRVLRGKFQGS